MTRIYYELNLCYVYIYRVCVSVAQHWNRSHIWPMENVVALSTFDSVLASRSLSEQFQLKLDAIKKNNKVSIILRRTVYL